MDFNSETSGDTMFLTALDRRIDAAGAVEFKENMRAFLAQAPGRVVLDLSHVEFIDSSGLGALVAIMKLVTKERALELAGLQPAVQGLFRLTRLDSIFTIHESRDAARRTA